MKDMDIKGEAIPKVIIGILGKNNFTRLKQLRKSYFILEGITILMFLPKMTDDFEKKRKLAVGLSVKFVDTVHMYIQI